MSTNRILSQVSDRVACITLNRPEVLNAFEGTMREELLAALERAADDRAVRCVMITGAGRAFCAGGDIASMAELQADNNDGVIKDRMVVGGKIIRLIRSMAKPVIAAVNGAAAGAGMNLALGCDLRLGADTARFAESFVKIGLVPDWAGFSSLPRLVGTAKALELMLTGERIDAAEALRLGSAQPGVCARRLSRRGPRFCPAGGRRSAPDPGPYQTRGVSRRQRWPGRNPRL